MIAIKCVRCGAEGLHACTGRVLPSPTQEDIDRLNSVLDTLHSDQDDQPEHAPLTEG